MSLFVGEMASEIGMRNFGTSTYNKILRRNKVEALDIVLAPTRRHVVEGSKVKWTRLSKPKKTSISKAMYHFGASEWQGFRRNELIWPGTKEQTKKKGTANTPPKEPYPKIRQFASPEDMPSRHVTVANPAPPAPLRLFLHPPSFGSDTEKAGTALKHIKGMEVVIEEADTEKETEKVEDAEKEKETVKETAKETAKETGKVELGSKSSRPLPPPIPNKDESKRVYSEMVQSEKDVEDKAKANARDAEKKEADKEVKTNAAKDEASDRRKAAKVEATATKEEAKGKAKAEPEMRVVEDYARSDRISRILSRVLRHEAIWKYGLAMQPDGYCNVAELLCIYDLRKEECNVCDIQLSVARNGKSRMSLSNDKLGNLMVRCEQGHTIPRRFAHVAGVARRRPLATKILRFRYL